MAVVGGTASVQWVGSLSSFLLQPDNRATEACPATLVGTCGIGYHTPTAVHHGHAAQVQQQRAAVLLWGCKSRPGRLHALSGMMFERCSSTCLFCSAFSVRPCATVIPWSPKISCSAINSRC